MSAELHRSLSLSAVITVAPQQVSCDIQDEVIVLNVRDGVYYGLNSVAARVWELLQQPRSVASIRDILLDEFDVDADECTSDVLDLLNQLKDWDLIELRNGAGG